MIVIGINTKKAGIFINPALKGISVLINIPEIRNPTHPNIDIINQLKQHFQLLYLLYNQQILISARS